MSKLTKLRVMDQNHEPDWTGPNCFVVGVQGLGVSCVQSFIAILGDFQGCGFWDFAMNEWVIGVWSYIAYSI